MEVFFVVRFLCCTVNTCVWCPVIQMSARGGSHKRSLSLSTLSRPSVGAGHHGAQRVSGAAFDNRVRSSGGNSMMVLSHTLSPVLVFVNIGLSKVHTLMYNTFTARLNQVTSDVWQSSCCGIRSWRAMYIYKHCVEQSFSVV